MRSISFSFVKQMRAIIQILDNDKFPLPAKFFQGSIPAFDDSRSASPAYSNSPSTIASYCEAPVNVENRRLWGRGRQLSRKDKAQQNKEVLGDTTHSVKKVGQLGHSKGSHKNRPPKRGKYNKVNNELSLVQVYDGYRTQHKDAIAAEKCPCYWDECTETCDVNSLRRHMGNVSLP